MSACAPRGAMHNGLCPELIRAIATEIWAFEIPAKLVTVVGSEATKSVIEAHLYVVAMKCLKK
jgi:hypothetical protein